MTRDRGARAGVETTARRAQETGRIPDIFGTAPSLDPRARRIIRPAPHMKIRFLTVEIDDERRTVVRGGRAVPTTPKAFDLLLYLVCHPDRVVTRRELLLALWPGEHVSESALTKCVTRARQAVGDVHPRKRIIATVNRRGFRFVAPIDVSPAAVGLPIAPSPAAFQGRGHELDRLGAAWSRARAGTRQVVLVTGEPGIGKTRLAGEFAARAASDGVVLYGRCEDGGGPAFQPFLDALRQWAARPGVQFGRLPGELARLMPELAEIVPAIMPLPSMDVELERQRLFDAVASWLATVARTAPLLLILDDLQWASASTALLLRHVLRETAAERLLVVATVRDTETDPRHPIAALADVLHEQTAGNPLFVGEILRSLRDSGDLERLLADPTTKRAVDVPSSVRTVIRRRVGRLGAPTGEALACAAAIGSEFHVRVLGRVVATSEAELLDALGAAVAARLLDESGPGRFRFAHELVRATLYEDLSATRRAALHRRIGDAIEATPAAEVPLAVLAFHYGEAARDGDADKAVQWLTRAGERAAAELAHAQAVVDYRRALDLLGRSADPRTRCELLVRLGAAERAAADPALVWYAASQRAIVHFEAGELAESERWFDRVTKLADDAGHRHFQWLAAFMNAGRAQYAGRLADAESLAEKALQHGDGFEHEARPNFWWQLLQIRDDQGRLEEMAEALAIGVRDIDRPLVRAMLAHVACETGDTDEAHRLLRQDRFEIMAEDAVWPVATTLFAEAAAGLGDTASAARLLPLLAPFRSQVAYSSNATRGAIARYTGLLAARAAHLADAHGAVGVARRAATLAA